MKTVRILTISVLLSVFGCWEDLYAQGMPGDPVPPDCSDGWLESGLPNVNVYRVNTDNDLIAIDCEDTVVGIHGVTPYGEDGSIATFHVPELGEIKGVNILSFQSRVNIIPNNNSASDDVPSYINFAEISREYTTDSAPSIANMIASASISYTPMPIYYFVPNVVTSSYNLIVNYQTKNGEGSLEIELDENDLEFDLTLTWLNNGCIHGVQVNCAGSTGQIEVIVSYPATGVEVVRLISGLNYQEFNSSNSDDSQPIITFWQAKSVHWGELDNNNFNGEIIFGGNPDI